MRPVLRTVISSLRQLPVHQGHKGLWGLLQRPAAQEKAVQVDLFSELAWNFSEISKGFWAMHSHFIPELRWISHRSLFWRRPRNPRERKPSLMSSSPVLVLVPLYSGCLPCYSV